MAILPSDLRVVKMANKKPLQQEMAQVGSYRVLMLVYMLQDFPISRSMCLHDSVLFRSDGTISFALLAEQTYGSPTKLSEV